MERNRLPWQSQTYSERSRQTQKLSLLVLAKMDTFPYWPGYIDSKYLKKNGENLVEVLFLGDYTSAKVAESNIEIYSQERNTAMKNSEENTKLFSSEYRRTLKATELEAETQYRNGLVTQTVIDKLPPNLSDLVIARHEVYPEWPSKVEVDPDSDDWKNGDYVCCYFLGGDSHAWVHVSNVVQYTDNRINKVFVPHHSKLYMEFLDACNEAYAQVELKENADRDIKQAE